MGTPPGNTDNDRLAAKFGHECRRKILGRLHIAGRYLHFQCRPGGPVCCFEAGGAEGVPEDWVPSPAQSDLWMMRGRAEG